MRAVAATDAAILRGATAILKYLAARGLNISDRSLRRWVAARTFPACKSRQLGITTTADRIDQWLAEQAGTGPETIGSAPRGKVRKQD